MDPNFEMMPFEDQVAYVIDNINNIPDRMVDRAINLLVQAGEVDLAAMLARDRGMIFRAIEILVESGDYLWAALMAKNAGMPEEAERLYRQGLGFYVDRGMFGRAIAAATALDLPQDEIASLFYKGVEVESQLIDPERAEALMCELEPTLEIARACAEREGYPGEEALRDYGARDLSYAAVDWPERAGAGTGGRGSVFDTERSRTQWGTPASQWGSPATEREMGRGPEQRWVRIPITEEEARGPEAAQAPAEGQAGQGAFAQAPAMSEEETSRWRTGSFKGMRSQEGTGALSSFDTERGGSGAGMGSQTSSELGREGTSPRWSRSGRSR